MPLYGLDFKDQVLIMKFLSHRFGLSLVFALCLLTAPSHATEKTQNILVFGDSLSAGFGLANGLSWPDLLQQKLTEQGFNYQVQNESISGETATGGLARLPKTLSKHQPSIVILELGANDGLRGQSIKRLQQQLQTMVNLIEKQPSQLLLLGIKIPPNYGKRYSESFEQVFQKIANDNKLVFEPFFLKDVALNKTLMQNDGMHPNASGQPYLLNNIWPKLKPLLQQSQ